MIKIQLKILNRYYNAEGESVEEALNKVKIPIVKGAAILIIEEDGRKREKVLDAFTTRNYFGPGGRSSKEIATKRLKMLLGI